MNDIVLTGLSVLTFILLTAMTGFILLVSALFLSWSALEAFKLVKRQLRGKMVIDLPGHLFSPGDQAVIHTSAWRITGVITEVNGTTVRIRKHWWITDKILSLKFTREVLIGRVRSWSRDA